MGLATQITSQIATVEIMTYVGEDFVTRDGEKSQKWRREFGQPIKW